ncbi:helix-turn-helix domain-containing protein [archaeon]|nr:helix-turn-helix domain-containing protein [archaeon]
MPYDKDLTKRIRDELCISQFKLAVMIDRTPQTVNNWENGHNTPHINFLDDLYSVCQQNGIEEFTYMTHPTTGEPISVSVEGHYEGPLTVEE